MEVHNEQRKKQPNKNLIILSFTENTALMSLLMKTTNTNAYVRQLNDLLFLLQIN